MTDTQRYIYSANRAFARPPFLATNALLQSGWLKSSFGPLQSFLDSTLNRVLPGHRFITPLPTVLYTGLFVPQMRSGNVIDASRGYVAETDISFWILTYGGKIGDEGHWALRWTPAFMFVNDAAAVAGGREVYGFPKLMAEVARTAEAPSDYGLEVTVPALKVFGPNEQVEPFKLIEIDSASAGPNGADRNKAENTWRDVARSVVDQIASDLIDDLRLPQLSFPILSLKQFPSVENPDLAAYQALVSSKMTSTAIHDIGGVDGKPKLTINPAQSILMTEVLGLDPTSEMEGGLWVVQDFTAELGTVLGPDT